MSRDRAFVVMQVGEKESPERRRADDIFKFIITPALGEFDIEAYRADLDPSPGGINSKMLSALVTSRLVIADLTGRNPNVFYELGIVHSFAKPLISIADAASSLPFDTKDERVIELGAWSDVGLTYAQGELAKRSLIESLKVVLADGYLPPSPLRDLAANRSLDELAPDNPVAAELAQMRETLEEIRVRMVPRAPSVPLSIREDLRVLREAVERNVGALEDWEMDELTTEITSTAHDRWLAELRAKAAAASLPELSSDPWASPPSASPTDEPPF